MYVYQRYHYANTRGVIMSKIYWGAEQIPSIFQKIGSSKVLLVCGKSFRQLNINTNNWGVEIIKFSNFTSNPVYESAEAGVKLFLKEKCDTIIAIGGGSAIDIAKCVKLFSNMDQTRNYLQQES